MKSLLPLFALIAGSFALLAACGDSGTGGELDVKLDEWSITVDKETLPKGPIEFTIKNDGERKHEFLIVKTDIAPDDLPTNDDGSFDQDAPDVDVVREVEDLEDGDKTGRTYDLDAGEYAFICNRVEEIDGTETSHYAQGMRAGFTVTEEDSSGSASSSATPTPGSS